MPIEVKDTLPAVNILENENIFIMHEARALEQDFRPLKIALLNLMPLKVQTETQFLRLLSNNPIQLKLTLLTMASHQSKNTDKSHLDTFYQTFDEVKDERFDALIITGAPIEHLEYEDVDYWAELCSIMEWSKTHVYSTFHVCWGAMAGLYYHYKINKYPLTQKLSGIYKHKVLDPLCPLFRGFDERFYVPHSRNTDIKESDIIANDNLILLSNSKVAGLYLCANKDFRQFFSVGHAEYDRDTLKNEYLRDLEKGINPNIPANYFPDDEIENEPQFLWRAHANLLFSNWLNYYVYQKTPYDLSKLIPVLV